jgi:hypothetical protein
MPKVITILVLIFKKVYKHALTFERSPPRSREERQILMLFDAPSSILFCQSSLVTPFLMRERGRKEGE